MAILLQSTEHPIMMKGVPDKQVPTTVKVLIKVLLAYV